MLIIHSVRKLLNTSRVEAALYITEPNQSQYLHGWYARLLPSGFAGKMMVMYVHEPSLMCIVCKGKTIQGTWDNFLERLEALLKRFNFPNAFIKNELLQAEGYVISKTNSRSMLSFMNQMVFDLEYNCMKSEDFAAIPLDWMEEQMMDRPYQQGKKQYEFRTPLQYWQQAIGLVAR
ncbi:MAG: hypothetical protein P4L51_08430 [Puia sp.]|nr:hypothetical protein [Puia sp.]